MSIFSPKFDINNNKKKESYCHSHRAEEEEVEDNDKDGGDKPQSSLEKITKRCSTRSRNTAAEFLFTGVDSM